MKLDTIKFPKQKSVRGGWFLSYILVLIVPLLLCLLLYNYSAGIITACDNSICNFLSEIILCSLLHLLENHCRNLLWSIFATSISTRG